MATVTVSGRIQSGEQHFTRRMTRYEAVFSRVAQLNLYPGTLNVHIGAPLLIREDFRIIGAEIGEPDQDLLFERCRVEGIPAFRIRPYQLATGRGGWGDHVIEIACERRLLEELGGYGATVTLQFEREDGAV